MKNQDLITKVAITDAVDIKEMRSLMKKHQIEILDESTSEGKFIFTLKETEDQLEDILVATHLSWDFYWQ